MLITVLIQSVFFLYNSSVILIGSYQSFQFSASSGTTELTVLQNGGGGDLISSTISTHGMRHPDFPDVIRRHQKKTCCCTIS